MTDAPAKAHATLRSATRIAMLALLALLGHAATADAAPAVGQPAPDFTAVSTDGKPVALADLRGRTVVLEWTNHECPFVQRHYSSGNMQALQKEATAADVIWLTVISSAPGEQGHVSAAEADRLTGSRGAAPTAVIRDETGAIGRAYEAKTTPHMYIIDPAGILVYMGAIDDQPRNAGATPREANNYVRAALTAVKAGQPVAMAVTQPYGCSVKYGS
jgi:peroxiredoxin